MNIRSYTEQETVISTSRLRLPRDVNATMDKWNKLAHMFHAKVTFIPGVERPFGPLGNWTQAITVTLEGDYDDPKCQEFFDAIYANDSKQLERLVNKEIVSSSTTNKTSNTTNSVGTSSTKGTQNNITPQNRVIAVNNSDTAPLLKRIFMFLEDGDWDRANEYCETVLDLDPENAQAYLGKLMAELKTTKQESLKDPAQPFDGLNNYQKAVRFADDKLKAALAGYIEHINTRNENARLDGIYTRAKNAMSAANTESAYKEAAHLFETISEYQDSAVLAQSCYEKAEIARKDAILSEGKSKMTGEIISNYESAIKLFESISGWQDADEKVYACQKKIEGIKAKAEAKRLEKERNAKRNKKIAIITTPIVCAIIAFIIVLNTVIIPNGKYNDAIALMDAEKYSEAVEAFEALGHYKDSAAKIEECKYNDAIALMNAGDYTKALSTFDVLDGYKDSEAKKAECHNAILEIKYNDAIALMDAGKYSEAISAFEAMDGYKDSTNKISECNTAVLDGKYNDAITLMDAGNIVEAYEALVALDGYKDSTDKANSIYHKYKVEKLKVAKVGDYVFFGAYEQDNNTSNGKEDVVWLVLEIKGGKVLVISKYALDCKQYNTSFTGVEWETCTLRKWLNNDFINAAFSADEKAMIPTVTVSADMHPQYSRDPGNATQDQVFLLSITEANKYFSSNSARQCKPTYYAFANGVDVNSVNNCGWWLRTSGYSMCDAAGVDVYGDFDMYGNDVDNDIYAVRPALWIDLNA